MSLWRIAYRSIQQRGLASCLTAFSMALGVMLVVVVLSLHGVIWESFRTNASLGYNIIVGAKGGKLQLTLNTVYYLSSPVENIDYAYYLEFLPPEERDRQFAKLSFQAKVQQAVWEDIQLGSLAAGTPGAGMVGAALEQADAGRSDVTELFYRDVVPRKAGRPTRFAQFTELAIPLCLGDYYGRFRVVGTTPAMFSQLKHGPDGDRDFSFSAGRNFVTESDEHGFFEAVVGATVAREKQVGVGDQFSPTHGDPDGHGHDRKFTIVGVLDPTGTPQDRGVFVNIEGFYLMEDHAEPVEEQGIFDDESNEPIVVETEKLEPLPIEQREVTSILVRTNHPIYALALPNSINEGAEAQAVLPVEQITNLFSVFVQPIQYVLLALTAMICLVSGISILVSIYNSMSDRRHEIAVMRALGAGRGTVMMVILLESVMLSVGGGMLGWTLGHAVNWLASGRIEEETGVRIGFFDLAPGPDVLRWLGNDNITASFHVSAEALLIPALLLLAVLVGFLPAISAYRTDVAESLGK